MIKARELVCEHQGVMLKGKIAIPKGVGPHPTVMVMYNAMGMSDTIQERIIRLADLGYLAVATDMYGDGLHFNKSADVAPYILQFNNDPELLRSRILHWFECIAQLPETDVARMAAIGCCFGGQCVLELARMGADVKQVVSFHGLLTTSAPAKPGSVKAKIAVFTGSKDPYVPREHVDELRHELSNAGVDWHITEYGNAFHAFTEPDAHLGDAPGRLFTVPTHTKSTRILR